MASNITSNITLTCLSTYSGRVYMASYQRYILVTIDVIVMILNFVANSGAVIVLFMTKFTRNTSLILLFFLSISDICLALITQTLFAILIGKYSDQSYCMFEMVVQFFAIFLTHTSGYTIACIGFDRYARMRFLNKYSLVVTKRKVSVALTVICLLSFFQAMLYVLGTKYNIFQTTKKVAIGIDFVIAFLVISIYLLTIKIVRDYHMNSQNRNLLSKTNRTVTRLASKILLAIFLFYISYISISTCHFLLDKKVKKDEKSWLNFALHFGYILTYCNSFVNAILFLTMNKNAKFKILTFLHTITDSDSGNTKSVTSSWWVGKNQESKAKNTSEM